MPPGVYRFGEKGRKGRSMTAAWLGPSWYGRLPKMQNPNKSAISSIRFSSRPSGRCIHKRLKANRFSGFIKRLASRRKSARRARWISSNSKEAKDPLAYQQQGRPGIAQPMTSSWPPSATEKERAGAPKACPYSCATSKAISLSSPSLQIGVQTSHPGASIWLRPDDALRHRRPVLRSIPVSR